MTSIIEMYENNKDLNDVPKGKNKDKTPISPDGGVDLLNDEKLLERSRGGRLNTKKYSDSITR